MIKYDCVEKIGDKPWICGQVEENQKHFPIAHRRKSILTGLKQSLGKLGDFTDAYMHRPEPVLLNGGPILLISNRQ